MWSQRASSANATTLLVGGIPSCPSFDPRVQLSIGGRERPLMLVDISVPLNVAKGCEDVTNVRS